MKAAGLLLLLSGWLIVLTALGLLTAGSTRAGFILAGIAVELVGLILLIRAHIPNFDDGPEERRSR